MKHTFVKSCGLLVLITLSVQAESWTGTLVDVMCKKKDLASHTTKCALACAKGGYGLVLADGTFLKLDEAGNAKAAAALKGSSKGNDLKARVTGIKRQQLIKVEAVYLR